MPGIDPYTHHFHISVGDGGKYVKGLVEFNTDGKVSFKMNQWSEPLPADFLDYFKELMDLCQKIYKHFDGIKIIKIDGSD